MIVIRSKRLRSVLRWAVPFAAMPLTALLGFSAFAQKRHLFISLMAIVWALILFASGFDNKKTGSRRLVIVSVMAALCVVGRFIPFFKPVTALTIITAIYFGAESGFLVGALSALVSNFYFGQGPWTAFQMLAWGLIGLVSGYCAVPLKKSRLLLVLFGFVSGIVYSMLMDVWTVMWYDGGLNLKLYAAALVTALPHTMLYSVSNVLFLWYMAKPFGEKLERVRIKYRV